MALWLVRAGRYGEHEDRFFSTGRIYLTWGDTFAATDPTSVKDYKDVRKLVDGLFPDDSTRKRGHTAGQFWGFIVAMKHGDWVITPRKTKAAIAVGEVTGPASYEAKAIVPYFVSRPVNWFELEVPRAAFDQDLLYSFGAFMTICQVSRNDAEKRVRAMATAGWKAKGLSPVVDQKGPTPEPSQEEAVDLEQIAGDQIAKLLQRQFTGHGLARIVAAVLEAQGYTTHVSPVGPDKGVDILAAPGPLGFGRPRICVQVKSGETPVDRQTLDQLIGVMQNFGADQGLLVSWGGFKSSVDKETAGQFFRVRLWDARSLRAAAPSAVRTPACSPACRVASQAHLGGSDTG